MRQDDGKPVDRGRGANPPGERQRRYAAGAPMATAATAATRATAKVCPREARSSGVRKSFRYAYQMLIPARPESSAGGPASARDCNAPWTSPTPTVAEKKMIRGSSRATRPRRCLRPGGRRRRVIPQSLRLSRGVPPFPTCAREPPSTPRGFRKRCTGQTPRGGPSPRPGRAPQSAGVLPAGGDPERVR
jgi:hypothetical protein